MLQDCWTQQEHQNIIKHAVNEFLEDDLFNDDDAADFKGPFEKTLEQVGLDN